MCKAISAIKTLRRRWIVRSKVLSDELEEDEDLHNKLKCDQHTSDEQIAADNVKISTLETSISGESTSVAQITEEIDTLEKDLLAESEISEFADTTAICEKQLVEYREDNKSMSSDIENSMLSQLKASSDECVVIVPTVPRNQRVFPAVCQSEW